MSNNNKSAAQKAAERAMSEDDKKPQQQTATQQAPEKAVEPSVDLIADTERRALQEENARLTEELRALKEKTSHVNRQASVYEPGAEIPEHHGIFHVELSAPPKDGRPAHVMFNGDLVALDEPDALRQGIAALSDKMGWQTPPHWLVRKVNATKDTLEQREDRIRFRKWRAANAKREDRGENLLPLPSNLSQFRSKLTETEELATSGVLATAK